jgi:hypothetical protein
VLERVRGGGVSLKRHGSDWIGLCPFHEDVNPSLVVTPFCTWWLAAQAAHKDKLRPLHLRSAPHSPSEVQVGNFEYILRSN